MAIRGKNLSATNKDGEKVNLAGSNSGNFGDSHAFTLVAADWYTAEVRSVKEAYIRMAVKDAESDESDGKFRHLRLQPDFRLHNENGTIISRQTFVVGAVDDEGNILQPNPDRDAIWGGLRGSREFLTAIKAFSDNGDGGFNLEFHAPAIRGLIVRVMTSIGAYRKGEAGDVLPNELKALLNEHSDEPIEFTPESFDLEAINAALDALNAAKGYTEETGYKLKNVVVKIVPLWQNKAEEEGLYVQTRSVGDGETVPTGRIFVDEEAADAFEEAMANSDLADGF
jgi:hypothetical protein